MALIMTNQQQKVPITPQWEADYTKLTDTCLKLENIATNAEISLVFVDDQQIRELNRIYRGKDTPTDVLSFPMYDDPENIDEEEEILLGDIVISLETAQRQAEEFGHSIEREAAYLLVHGLLHLLGYDHLNEEDKKNMRKREEELLEAFGLKR